MKHILLEKYLLSEATTKRFILNEESAEDTIVNALNKVLDRVTKTIAKINSLKTDFTQREATVKGLQDLIDQAELTDDPKITQAKIKEYITKVEALFPGKRINLYPTVKQKFTALKQLANVPTLKVGDKQDLITQAKEIQADLINGPTSTDDNGKAATIKKLEEVSEKLNALKDNPGILTTDTKEALASKQALQTFYSALPKIDEITTAKYDQIQSVCTNFLNAAISTVSATIAGSQKKNWAELYATAETDEDRSSILAEYFATEWGEAAGKIRALETIFLAELFELGWDSVNNPFIYFLRKNINRLNITKETYSVIHNAYVRGQINGADLKGKGEFGEANIILNPNLYLRSAMSMEPYINEQAKLKNNKYKLASEAKSLFSTLDGRIKVLCNLFLVPGNPANLSVAVGDIYAQLKTINEVKANIKLVMETEEKQEITPDEAVRIVKAYTGDAKKAITYLLNSYALNYYKEITAINTTRYKVIDTANRNPITFEEATVIRNQLGLDNIEMTKDVFKAILIAMAEKAGVAKVEK